MSNLEKGANIARPDDVYELLLRIHDGLTEEQSWRVNAKLILLLLNEVGDEQLIREAIAAARHSLADECADSAQVEK